LSPFLFFLLISPLAKMLREKRFGIQMGPECRIACLLYADDLVLLASSEAEKREIPGAATRVTGLSNVLKIN
jgi:hypothetical protein